jgi:hypothetical protein
MFLQGAWERDAPGMLEAIEAHQDTIDDLVDDELIDHLVACDGNPFEDHAPARFNEVHCEGPEPPLTMEQIRVLEETLREEFDMTMKNMEVSKLIWDRALRLCHTLW